MKERRGFEPYQRPKGSMRSFWKSSYFFNQELDVLLRGPIYVNSCYI